ncbi:MAG: hypothetical protein RI972_543, partial [Pseudomonadota bacterium]
MPQPTSSRRKAQHLTVESLWQLQRLGV